jgi:hypothetical protein
MVVPVVIKQWISIRGHLERKHVSEKQGMPGNHKRAGHLAVEVCQPPTDKGGAGFHDESLNLMEAIFVVGCSPGETLRDFLL